MESDRTPTREQMIGFAQRSSDDAWLNSNTHTAEMFTAIANALRKDGEATPGGGAPPPCPRCHGTGRERDGLDVDGKSWPCGLCNSGEPFERHCEDLGG